MKSAHGMLFGLLLSLLTTAAWAAGPVGFVAGVRGDAKLTRGQQIIEARIGLAVEQGDELSTGEKSRLKVLLSDDSVVALGSSSRLVLAEHLFSSKSKSRITRLKLLGGLMRALVQKSVGGVNADFQVASGTAVAGVRGTEFVLDATGQAPRLASLSGAVAWSSAGGSLVEVGAGQASRMGIEGPDRPEALAAVELSAIKAATDSTQQPSALAWNLATDRLSSRPGQTPARVGSERDPSSEDGTDQAGFGRELPYDSDLNQEPTDVGNPGDGDFDHGRFSGDQPVGLDSNENPDGALYGGWEDAFGFDQPVDATRDFDLRIRVHRQTR
jgi:hypothetical protein